MRPTIPLVDASENNEIEGVPVASQPSGHQPSASALRASQSGVPNAGYTPGPWSLSNGNLIRVNGPDLAHGWKRPVVVCGVHRIGKCRNGPDADRLALANARLIAAAPELLEALEKCAFYIGSPHRMSTDDAEDQRRAKLLQLTRAAIAKARGQ